ncbi:MAG: IS3 family transposase [Acidimicrobiia bacterium]
MSRRFVSEHADRYPVTRLCALAGVPRSTFYEWRSREPSQRDRDDAALTVEIVDIHTASHGTYGAPRVCGQLRHRGIQVGRKRVARLMAAEGLVGVHGRRKWRKGRPNTAPAPDRLQRDFTAEAPDQRWVADITEFACWDGTLYLAGIKDLCDQSIVGWSMGVRQTTDLAVNALVMALGRRHPDDELIHHADRGSQYTSLEFSNRMADWGIAPSFSRTGNCYDNAAMETTWATIKREIRHIYGDWSQMTRSQLRTVLFEYIETFYNRNRHQAPLGHRTPAATYADHAA